MADQLPRREGGLIAPEAGVDARARDTIAARATASGAAAIAVVRLSGPAALSIAETLAGRTLTPRLAEYVTLRDRAGETIDRGLAIAFEAPASFTGEDVVELQVHGGAVVVDWLLETVYRLGARPAGPGEFSLRAFLNDKLDLTQAEAIADLIASTSRAGAKAALRSLDGQFAAEVRALQAALTELRVLAEAWLDFPDEEIERGERDEVERRLGLLREQVVALESKAGRGVALNDGLRVAIAGPPNAGKSSLLNRLAGLDVAIVTDLPGTTRDALRERLVVGAGVAIDIVDTAGLRASEDPIEREGVRRARAEVGRAEHVLFVADIRDGLEAALAGAAGLAAELEAGAPSRAGPVHPGSGPNSAYTVVLNKVDLTTGRGARRECEGVTILEVSALEGEGIELLVGRLEELAGIGEGSAGTFSARRRHLHALERVRGHLEDAQAELPPALELAAEELRAAQLALSELTGEFTSDDLLGAVFSSFCIGK